MDNGKYETIEKVIIVWRHIEKDLCYLRIAKEHTSIHNKCAVGPKTCMKHTGKHDSLGL